MRTVPTGLLFIVTLGAGVASGQKPQNFELGFMAGPAFTKAQSVAGASASASTGFLYQMVMAHQWRTCGPGELFFELPWTFEFHGESTVTGASLTSFRDTEWYFTPGLSFHRTVSPRVTLYAALGGGFGSLDRHTLKPSTSGVEVRSEWNLSPVLDFGGGIDFRLSRSWSLRGDVRDFVTRTDSNGNGRHNPIFTAGVVYHR